MMQDFIRTSTYQKAILDNPIDFNGKVVLDVGAGSGILSFFAQQSGAKRVYAVEASSIAMHANKLVAANRVDEVIKVVSGKIEEIELPEQVDMIISEPMGYMLLNERMLETFLHAKKFLSGPYHVCLIFIGVCSELPASFCNSINRACVAPSPPANAAAVRTCASCAVPATL